MTREDTLKLAIYERYNNNELSYTDKELLLEKVEEGHNTTFISSYRKAVSVYKEDIKASKKSISKKNISEAKLRLTKAKTDLNKLKTVVENTPSTLSDTAQSQCLEIIRNTFVDYGVTYLVNAIVSGAKTHLNNQADKLSKMDGVDPNVLKQLKAPVEMLDDPKISKMLKPSVLKSLASSVVQQAAIDAGRQVITHGEQNKFKRDALKKINKELVLITKLESRL